MLTRNQQPDVIVPSERIQERYVQDALFIITDNASQPRHPASRIQSGIPGDRNGCQTRIVTRLVVPGVAGAAIAHSALECCRLAASLAHEHILSGRSLVTVVTARQRTRYLAGLATQPCTARSSSR